MKPHSLQERTTKILTTPLWLPSCTDSTYNNCAEIHLGGGVLSPFVFLLSAIVTGVNCLIQLLW